MNDEEYLIALRVSIAHILAQAVSNLFPEVKLGTGPAIENGFYYDFDLPRTLSSEDLVIIEEEMKKIIKKDLNFEQSFVKKDSALDYLHQVDQPYKAEIAAGVPEDKLSFYTTGKFKELSRKPHIKSTSEINTEGFKLTHVAGAYWQSDESRNQMQRIYGVAFLTKQELDKYFELIEEAKKRDHRKLGQELELFILSEDVGAGLPMYLPRGAFIKRVLEDYMYEKEKAAGYQYVYTPAMANEKLYEKSGHAKFYKDNMYSIMVDGEKFYLRPMNCPHHFMIYKSKVRSYRDLPIAYNEFADDYRYELSGAVTGLIRTRAFTQNDCHIFCRPDQVKDEFIKVLNMFNDVYKDFGLKDYWFRLSLPDFENDKEKYPEKAAWWEEAVDIIKRALDESNAPYTEGIGEASFYGPKLDVQIKNVLGKEDTIATCQLDYYMPRNFDMNYTDSDGVEKPIVVIHRAIMGSFDRFFAFLIERTGGHFPLWISPTQIVVIPISEKQDDYAFTVKKELEEKGFRVDVDDENASMQNRIRKAQTQKIPYMLILGDKELIQRTVSVRPSQGNDLGMMKMDEFLDRINRDLEEKR